MRFRSVESWITAGTWNLRVWWILASATGFALGAAVSFAGYQLNDDLFFVTVSVGMAVGGIVAAVLELPVLRRYFSRADQWVAVNIAGGAVTVVIYFTTGVVFDFIIGDPAGWAEVGTALGP